nr:PLP-dependent transferase [Enterococcus faecalis]
MHVENDKNICCEVEKGMEKMYHPMVPELVQTSSFYFPTYEEFMAASIDEKNNYVYTRGTNPTTEILEKKIARLERGEKNVKFLPQEWALFRQRCLRCSNKVIMF